MRKKFLLSKFLVLLILITGSVGVASAQIAKIGGNSYSTFAAALTAANNMTGDVTVEIYGAGEFTDGMELNGSYTSIKFIGKNAEAKLTVNQTAGGDYLGAHGKTVSFTDLILDKANPAWSGNSGHMGNYFSIQGGTVTYTNCTFPNGACTSGATATYTDCTFQNSSEYGLWVYDDALVTVNGGTIDSKKGIKVYSEGEESVTSTLTVQNATFTANVTAKPAVAVGYAQSITLIGNTYNNTTAHVELDSGSDADCEGITFVAEDAEGNDIASTLEMTDRSNSNAPCGVLCDGKIYTTVAQAAADATAGSTVTLLYNSTETVELPAGVILDKNNYEAAGITVTQPVAQIGETPYYTLAEAVAAAQDKDVIEIIKEGNYTLPEFAGKELTFKGSLGTSITDWVNKASQGMMGSTVHFEKLTISGQTENYYGLFHTNAVTYKDCNINGLRFLYSPTTFEGCQFNAENVEHSFWTYGASNVTVTDCTFTYTDRAVNCYSENGANHELDITFEGCSFTYAGTKDAPEGAVEINSSSVKSIDLVMDGCTAPAEGAMWFNSQWDSTGGAKTEVIVDDVVVWTAPVKIGETKYGSLQAAINAAVDGDVITLVADITEDVKITQKADLDLVINGQKDENSNYTFTGVMTVFGDARHDGNETLTIKNINFVAKNGSDACILSPDRKAQNPARYSYSHNVTVDNCTFTDPDGVVNCAAIRHGDGGDVNWTLNKCTVDNKMHSLIQTNNVNGKLVIAECIVNSKNGVNLNSCTNVEMTGCNFVVQGYALRSGVSSGGNLGVAKTYVLENNTLMSACDDGDAVIMFRASSVDANFSMEKNVVSGATHISGNTAATNIDADANYWGEGLTGPVVAEGSAPVVVNSYYSDEAREQLIVTALTLQQFVEKVTEGNGTYNGTFTEGGVEKNITVKVVPVSGDARTTDDVRVPNRLQKYTNPEVYYAQYQRFSELTDVNISNVNFVFYPAAVTVTDAWNTTGATTTADNINGELQLLNTGSVSFANCSFEKMSVSPINAATLSVTSSTFNGLDAYAIKDVKATTATITGTTFTDCNGGFWFNNAPTTLTVTDNTFTGTGRRGAIQFSANGDYANTEMTVTGNEVTDDAAFLWQLNNTISNAQLNAILDKNNNTYETAFVAGSVELHLQGEGTTDNPYLINDINDLKVFRDQVNAGNNYEGKYIKLTADIDLNNEEWTPIGNNTNQFKGYFDGNEKTISNLKVTGNTRYKGFFGYIKGTGMSATTTPSVKYLTLDGVNVNVEGDGYYVGGLAGQAFTCNITNVTVKGNVSGVRYVGGLVGHVYTYFKNCHFIGNASCSFDALGGIAGAGDCRAYDCSVIGDITGSNWVGGIVGNGQEGTSAVGCYVNGDVKTSEGYYRGVGGIAGVAGHGYPSSEFKNNYFDGEVYLEGEKVPAMIIGIVNANDNESIGTTVEGNSWNTEHYDAETPVYVTAEVTNDDTTEEWIAGASEELTKPRNNNLVMLESDIQYVEATDINDVTIMKFSEVTVDDILPQIEENNQVAYIDSNADGAYNEGETKYTSFEAALDAVQNGETITLLNRTGSEISKEIDFTKDIEFTITGNAPNYELPIVTFQNATVNIEDANFQIPELDARQNATINVINSTIVDAGGNSIAKSYFNGAINISGNSKVYMMQVTTMGYINISDNAELHATWQTNVYGNGLVTIEDNATFKTAALHLTAQDYSGRDNTDANRVGKPAEIVVDKANFIVGNVHSAGGADYSYNSSKGINIGTVEGKFAILNVKNGGIVNYYMANGETANIGAGGTVNVAASTFNTQCRAENGTVTLANNGTVYVTGTANLAANVTGAGWFYMNGVALDADTKLHGAKVGFINGENTIVGSTIDEGYFSVGIGQNAAAEAAAAFATTNNITLDNVTVNVSGDAIIDANGETYSGWVGSAYSADKTQHTYTLNVENSLATFGYMHVSKDGTLNVKGGHSTNKYTYDNANVDFYAGDFIVNGTVTLDATNAWSKYTKISPDHADGILNIVNGTNFESSIHNGGNTGESLIFYNAGKVNIDATSNVEIDNKTTLVEGAELNIASANVIAKGDVVTGNGAINLTDLNAKFTAKEGLTIVDKVNNKDFKVDYKEGTYQFVAKQFVAQIYDVDNNTNDDRRYESLQEAIEAVAEGETVKLMADVTITEAAHGQNALNHARAINFTLDLNDKTLSANTGNSVFRFNIAGSGATEDVTVTIKNGTVVSGEDTWCTLMSSGISADVRAVMNLEDLVIENYKGGDFAVKAWANGVVNAEGVTINSTYGGGFYALGGEITLENCTVNQKGLWTAPYNSMAVGVSNGGKMTVNSGTYSAVPLAATDGNNQGTSHGSWTGGVMSSGGTLIINGGTFSNGNIGGTATYPRELFIVGADADYGDNVNGQVIINGGTFTSIGDFIHCETIWGSANDPANTYMPTMGVTITAGDFTAVAGKTIGGCDPVSTGNPVDVEISGGSYGANHAIHNSYLADGYEVAQIDENVYEVRLSSFEKFYTAAGVETTSDDAAYSLSFTVTDYANNKVSVKIGSKIPVPNSNINLVTPSEVQFEDLTFNVTSVANSAFNGTHFKKVTISEGVETIGNKALYFMSKLTELVLPSTLVSVGEQCIGAYNPTSVPLKSIVCYAAVAPSAFEPTSNASFQTCVEQQTMLIVPNAADYTVYSNANGWKFTNILGIGSTKEIAGKDDKYTLLATVTSMNPMECSIKIGNTKPAANSNAELVIPETVTFFEGYDFNVTSIPNNAFKGCNNFVGDLVIPATVKTIGYMAFNASHNSNADALIFAENCELKTIDAWAFNAPFKGDFQLPTSLTSVGVSAFSNNGEGATLTITAGNKGYGRAFSGSKFNKLVVEEGVESLPGLAFYNTRFTEVELPSTLTNIAEGAFDDNTSITTITSNNPVPPTVQVSSNYIAFEQEVYNNATLFVPDHAAKKLYREAYVWKEFANISTPIITQTTQLSAGWNWFSAYVDIDLESLQNALGENATIIKNHTTGKWTKYEEGEWYGTLETISPKEMYIINTSNTIELTLVGELVELTPITIKNNWNAIGYMLNEPMSVESALNSIVPVHGDYIKSRDQYAAYDEIDGWYGTLETLIPGEGYMLKSNYSEDRLLTYSYPTRNSNSEVKDNITTDGNYWTPNHSQYPNNMTMTAMVEVEGGDYEVAAFVDGEVRGSARPIYVEALDAHILFLTIHGDEIEEMTFRYYDIATGEEFELNDRINYSNDAIIGSLTEPYIFNRGTTGIGEASLSDINIYPNPTTTGTEINLQATCDTVEVFNALGVKVAEYHNVDSIDAIETAGIYVIRITNGGNVKHCSLVVK